MGLETPQVLNFLLQNSFSPDCPQQQQPITLFNNNVGASGKPQCENGIAAGTGGMEKRRPEISSEVQKKTEQQPGNKKKRRRKERERERGGSKNKEESESQRMTHITVERNRRKMMTHYLSLLRSLMPQSYSQRGDQASIVGGSIDFLKELEHRLQTLEAQKLILLQQQPVVTGGASSTTTSSSRLFSEYCFPSSGGGGGESCLCVLPKSCKWKQSDTISDMEVILIESHANIRIVSRRRVKQLSTLVAAFHSMYLTILHLNVTTLDSDLHRQLAIYSISAQVEEGCFLSSAQEIGGAVNQILMTTTTIIEEV